MYMKNEIKSDYTKWQKYKFVMKNNNYCKKKNIIKENINIADDPNVKGAGGNVVLNIF